MNINYEYYKEDKVIEKTMIEFYGEEWQSEMMKHPKEVIINLYKSTCARIMTLEAEKREIEKRHTELCDAIDSMRERVKETESDARKAVRTAYEGLI